MTFNQKNDPSINWTEEEKRRHKGDIWIHDGDVYEWDGTKWIEASLDEIYDYTDIIIGTLNRKNIANFGKLKSLQKDEKVIIREVRKLYSEVDKYTRTYYLTLARKVYTLIIKKFGLKKKGDIPIDWLMLILSDYDEVTKYVYDHEVDRKAARLIEAMMASDDTAKEVESALRSWTKQMTQYADNVTDKAIKQAYKDNGITEVYWQTEGDARVCPDCERLDGRVFLEEDVPSRPHYGCRCTLIPLVSLEDDEDE